MKENLFPILGTEPISIVGRELLLDRIWRDLTKKTPSNLGIVGPKDIGKTVLLNELYRRATQADSPYPLVLYWEVGYNSPLSDEQFIEHLCEQLCDVMSGFDGNYDEYRNYLMEEKSFGRLKEVMDLLDSEDKSILMIWDGFDKPIKQGKLSGQLFAQLRQLFYERKHKIVTVTRERPSELTSDKQIEDSPFWNMFDTNLVRVGPFDSKDLENAIETSLLKTTSNGRKELFNWSGGNPIILLSFLNELHKRGVDCVDSDHVKSVADTVAVQLEEVMEKAWNHAREAQKDSLLYLVEQGANELGNQKFNRELDYWCHRGFAIRDQEKIFACRLLEKYLVGKKLDGNAILRFFGNWENYRIQILRVLELRMGQISVVSNRLNKLVNLCLDSMGDIPEDCLSNLTQIEEAALEVIWKYELGGDNVLGPEIVAYWTQHPRDKDNVVVRMMEANDWGLPRDRLRQLQLLQLLTGSKPNFEQRSKFFRKDAYSLLNAIHQFRNRTEHSDGQPIHPAFAVAVLMTCIELMACLERDLKQNI
jgi:hypothetical protein